jgi:signal transduction histidine kinase
MAAAPRGAYAVQVDSGPVTWWRWWRVSPLRDAVFAVVVTVILMSGTLAEAHPKAPADLTQFRNHVVPDPPLAALLLVVAGCLALAWRHRWPVTVLAVSTAAVTTYTLLGYVSGAALLAPAFALYAVASQVSVRRTIVLAVAVMAVLMSATAANNPFGHITGGGFDLIPALVAVAAFGGIAIANRRAFVASIQARADDRAQRQIDEERLRIARELHDVVAHTMATINVQASAAVHVAADRPDAAVDALQAIKGASKEGLRELRAILQVLRQADEKDSTQPAPGLAYLDSLIDGARRAGLSTTVKVTGDRCQLPPAADLAAYRIVQESLTNVIRHAGPATASVSLSYTGTELVIEVTDTGRATAGAATGGAAAGSAAAGDGGGHGLLGMRERAASVGGTVTAGPATAGGFRVLARLPLGPRTRGQPAPESARPGEAAGAGESAAPGEAAGGGESAGPSESAAPAAEGSRS